MQAEVSRLVSPIFALLNGCSISISLSSGSLSSPSINVLYFDSIFVLPFSLSSTGFGSFLTSSEKLSLRSVTPGLLSIGPALLLSLIKPLRISAAVDLSSGFRYFIFLPEK